MKKDLLIIPTYIVLTLFFTALLACFFVLYPMPGVDASNARIYIIDTFVFSALSLLPFMSVLALAFIILRSIKIGRHSFLEFLTYVFLCLSIWLIIIPIFLFTFPEQKVSEMILGQSPSLAQVFFQQETIPILIQNLEMNEVTLSSSVVRIFTDLVFLRDSARVFASQGRVSYLMFASLGLSLSTLISLRYVSSWKLINVAVILFLWSLLVWVNIQIYRTSWDFFLGPRWNAVVLNGAFTMVLIFIGINMHSKQKAMNKEAE